MGEKRRVVEVQVAGVDVGFVVVNVKAGGGQFSRLQRSDQGVVFDQGATGRVDQDRAVGHEQVLLTGALDFVAHPVARHLGIGKVVASRLEYAPNALATGVLRPPVMAGPEKAVWIREYAQSNDIDLRWSVAYADDVADLPMLSMVGRPAAINPDRALLATARSHGWPVLHIEATRSRTRDLARTVLELSQRGADRFRDESRRRTPVLATTRGALNTLRDRLKSLSRLAGGSADAESEESEP